MGRFRFARHNRPSTPVFTYEETKAYHERIARRARKAAAVKKVLDSQKANALRLIAEFDAQQSVK